MYATTMFIKIYCNVVINIVYIENLFALFAGEEIHDEQELANWRRFYHEAFQSGAGPCGFPHGRK